MAENLKQTIEFQAKGIAKLKKQYKELEQRTKGLEGATTKAGGALGGMVAKLGLTTVALYGAMRAISSVVRVGKDFEKNMSNVAAISGATGNELLALEANAKKLGATTVFTASQVSLLQTEFAKLGFSSKEIQGVTKDTLALAAASGSDLAVSAAVAGQTLRAFGLDVSETSRVTDTMALSFSSSALDMEKFTNSMQYVAPIAKQVGISVEGTTAMLGALANAGISGSMAGTSLRKILLELGNENSALTKKIGFSVKTSEDMVKAFEVLRQKGIGVAEAKDLVGQRAISAFNILLEGTDTVEGLTVALENSGGAAQRMADIQLDNLAGKMTLLNSAMEGLGIAIFDTVDGPLNSLVDTLTSVTSTMTTLIEKGISGLAHEFENLNNPIAQAQISATNLRGDFDRLTKSLLHLSKQESLSATQLKRRGDVLDELQSKYGNYFESLDVEKQSYIDIAVQVSNAKIQLDKYIQSILATATAQQFAGDIGKLNKELAENEQLLEKLNDPTQLIVLANEKLTGGYLSQSGAIKATEEKIESLNMKLDNQTELMTAAQKKANEFAEALTAVGDGVPKDLDLGVVVPDLPIDLGADDLDEFIRKQQDLVDAKAAESAWLDIIKTQYPVLAEDMGLITKANEAIILSEEQKAAIQSEFNDRYVEMTAGQYQLQFDELETASERFLAAAEGDAAEKIRIEEFVNQRKKQIAAEELSFKLGTISNLTGALGQLSQASKGAAIVSKRLAQATAVIDTYAAANKALAASPPPFNFVAAAAVVAAGLANVAQIEAQSFAKGGDFITKGPELIMVGEKGPEKVSVKPIERSEDRALEQTSNTYNISINAPLVDETVIDTIIPAIEKAKRLDLA